MEVKRLKAFALETREAEGGGHITTFIGSTAAVDRADDIVDQRSWKLDEFKANPVILQGHNPSKPVVGKAVKVEVREHDGEQALMFDVKFDDHPTNPDGQRIARQVREGFLSAVSVGFRSGEVVRRSQLPSDDPRKGEHGMLFKNNQLFELSVVAIPMNQDALAVRELDDFAEKVKAALIRLVESGDEGVARAVEAVRLAAPAIETGEGLSWFKEAGADEDAPPPWAADDDEGDDSGGLPWH